MAKRKAMTAEELMEKLANDSEYQEMMRKKEQQIARREKILDEDERDLVADCLAVGISISSVWDFVNMDEDYSAAIPILIEQLKRTHQPRTLEGIVRALTTSEARGIAVIPLLNIFKKTSDGESEFKWLTGAAIAETATQKDAQAILDLINDEDHGSSREFLPFGLIHLPKNQAIFELERLVEHPVMGKGAIEALSLISK